MAFNPNLPAAHAPIVSQELRDQFNALKALIDAQQVTIDAQAAQIIALTQQLANRPTMDDVNAAITANSSGNCNSMEGIQCQPSDPPTQNEVYSIVYQINLLINALHRQG
jgi:hypothetical protein